MANWVDIKTGTIINKNVIFHIYYYNVCSVEVFMHKRITTQRMSNNVCTLL